MTEFHLDCKYRAVTADGALEIINHELPNLNVDLFIAGGKPPFCAITCGSGEGPLSCQFPKESDQTCKIARFTNAVWKSTSSSDSTRHPHD